MLENDAHGSALTSLKLENDKTSEWSSLVSKFSVYSSTTDSEVQHLVRIHLRNLEKACNRRQYKRRIQTHSLMVPHHLYKNNAEHSIFKMLKL